MIKPDKAVLNAIASLDGDQRWLTVMTWIRESQRQVTERLLTVVTTEEMFVTQGRAVELKRFVEYVEQARESLQAMEKAL